MVHVVSLTHQTEATRWSGTDEHALRLTNLSFMSAAGRIHHTPTPDPDPGESDNRTPCALRSCDTAPPDSPDTAAGCVGGDKLSV